MLRKIVSGGQSGVDRAALDAALAHGLKVGGWCPRDRRAEDGMIASHYPLQETPSRAYRQRTKWNVRDSDGTLILAPGKPTGGTALTIRLTRRYQRPLCVVNLDDGGGVSGVCDWLTENRIATLNVAGPRASSYAGIQARAAEFLRGIYTGCTS